MKYLYWLVLAVLLVSLTWIILNARLPGAGPRNSNEGTAMVTSADNAEFTITSSAFADGEALPTAYTCDSDAPSSPPLTITNPPAGTKSFVLTMYDPDIPQRFKDERGIEAFDHWVMYGIPAGTREVGAGETPGTLGLSSAGSAEYVGACPPLDLEPTTHRYIFTVYALKGTVQFPSAPSRAEVEAAMENMILGTATLTGTYDRSNN